MQADGEWFVTGGETAGEADARDAGDVAGYGEDIAQVHLQWVAGFFTGFEGSGGAGGADDRVAFLKRLVEILFDKGTHFQRLQVVLAGVSFGKGVGADHDSALDLFTETFATGFAEQFDDIFDRFFGAMTEVHTVVAGQVAAAFAGGDDIVGGDAIFGMGERNVDNLGAH